MRDSLLCSNCGRPTGGRSVMSPTLDPKRRNQCIECSKEIITDTSPSWRPVSKQARDWEKEFDTKVNELRELYFLDDVDSDYIRCDFEHWYKTNEGIKDFIRSHSLSLIEKVEEWARKEKIKEGEFGFSDSAKVFCRGHNAMLNDLLSKIQEMKEKV